MRKKIALLTAAGVLGVSAIAFSFTSTPEECPLKGTEECPLTNCPLAGTDECPYGLEATNEILPCCSKGDH